jgi:hypothetical protein
MASFAGVTTLLVNLSHAVLHRTLGMLVLKNANQVHLCSTMLSLQGPYNIKEYK